MYELTVEARFSAAHAIMISGTREPVHGHDWLVTATIAGDELDADGLLCDFHTVEDTLKNIVRPFRSMNLNEVAPFDTVNPAAELVAKHIFDELHDRILAIDFDQQSYEGRKAIYMPQYFKQNNPIIQVGLKLMTPESVRQYQTEEHALMATRVRSSRYQIQHLMHAMANDTLAPPDNVVQLKNDLTELYKSTAFAHCQSMGDLVKMSLQVVLRMDI